ncbi:MAG: DUF1616 domain-containing protein [Methanophagales archaeon]|nr:DUF1616 domain-containing protein [Methanophagales archaeon]
MSTLKHFPNDLALVIFLTLLCIPFVLIPPLNETPVRIILGLPLVLFLPGYALIAALFIRKDDLDGIERIALSFGLSIAITPLLGLGLNYTPFGIRLTPILIVLSVFTIALAIGAYVRRSRIREADRFVVEFGAFFKSMKESFMTKDTKIDRILSVIRIISIVLAISITAYVIITPKEGEKFTEFYVLGPGGMAEDYPTNLTVGEEGEVIIGVVNHEYANTSYLLEVELNGEIIDEKSIELVHNETWESPFKFKALRKGADQKLEFLLYKVGEEGIYRSLHLWVDAI